MYVSHIAISWLWYTLRTNTSGKDVNTIIPPAIRRNLTQNQFYLIAIPQYNLFQFIKFSTLGGGKKYGISIFEARISLIKNVFFS